MPESLLLQKINNESNGAERTARFTLEERLRFAVPEVAADPYYAAKEIALAIAEYVALSQHGNKL